MRFGELSRGIAMLFVIVLPLGAGASCSRASTAHVTLINASGQDVEKATIGIGKNAVSMKLASGARTSAALPITMEGGYEVTVQFITGRRLHEQVGYLTNGLDSTDTVEIHADKIVLVDSPILDNNGQPTAR